MLRYGFGCTLVVVIGLGLCGNAAKVAAGELPAFKAQVIDADAAKVAVYALTLADVDGDKKTDIVAVTENRVLWYQNPTWKPRLMLVDAVPLDNVCIAPLDIDGDGQIDFALGAGWLQNRHLGTIHWITRGKSLDEPWKVYDIGRESWTHRVRFGDILGTGKPQLTVSPLNKTTGDGVRVLAFEIPANPKQDPWRMTVVDQAQNAMHNHWMGDLDGDGKTDMLTVGMHGVFLFRRGADNKLVKTQIGEGAPGTPTPQKTGAGEVRVGTFKSGKKFIVTVEPMHGNSVVVYTEPARREGMWTRHVLDDTLTRGHALAAVDIDRDGNDEIVLGHSDKAKAEPFGPGVFIYQLASEDGSKWTKHIVDNGGVATEDLVAQDLNGDGWVDIVAGGRASRNVKLYINQGLPPRK